MTTGTKSDDAATPGDASPAKKPLGPLQTTVRLGIMLVVCCAAIFWACRMAWENYYPLQAVTRRLGSSDSSQRVVAVHEMTELGATSTSEAIGALIPLLKDPDAGVRNEAAQALGTLGAQAVRSGESEAGATTSALLGLLHDPETKVRIAATGALRLVAGSTLNRSARGTAKSAKADSAPATAIDTTAVAAGLLGLLKDQNPDVRQAAISAVATIGPQVLKDPPRELLAIVESEAVSHRIAAIAALANFPRGLDPLIPTLLRHLERDEPQVRDTCAQALGRIQSSSLSTAVLPDLVKGLGSRDRVVRMDIIGLLSRLHPDANAVVPALITVLREPIDSDAMSMGNGGSISYIGPAHDAARALATIAPGTSAAEPAVTALANVVQNGPAQRKASAANALSSFGHAAVGAVPALVEMVGEAARSKVQNGDGASAAGALSEIAPGTPAAGAAASALIAALKAESIPTRTAAIEELAKFGSAAAAALPTLRELRENDPTPAVRRAAESALDKLEKGAK
jgi:HEAT repeat protein